MPIIQTTKELRPRDPRDFYPTPIELCRASLNLLADWETYTILDPGCGYGPWGKAAREIWPNAWIDGIDIELPLKNNLNYNGWWEGDFLMADHFPYKKYDLIIGNPPYKYAEKFIRRSWELLRPRGHLILLLRLAFLEGQKRGKGFWKQFLLDQVHILSRRPSFTGDQKTDATAYAVYIWREGWGGQRRFDWLDWDYDK